jgi:hypothetical protein
MVTPGTVGGGGGGGGRKREEGRGKKREKNRIYRMVSIKINTAGVLYDYACTVLFLICMPMLQRVLHTTAVSTVLGGVSYNDKGSAQEARKGRNTVQAGEY